MIIKQETKEDLPAVYALSELVFGQPLEANIIDKLRHNSEGLLSLVAIEGK